MGVPLRNSGSIEKRNIWMESFDIIRNEIPLLIELLENEFQNILGLNEQNIIPTKKANKFKLSIKKLFIRRN